MNAGAGKPGEQLDHSGGSYATEMAAYRLGQLQLRSRADGS